MIRHLTACLALVANSLTAGSRIEISPKEYVIDIKHGLMLFGDPPVINSRP